MTLKLPAVKMKWGDYRDWYCTYSTLHIQIYSYYSECGQAWSVRYRGLARSLAEVQY